MEEKHIYFEEKHCNLYIWGIWAAFKASQKMYIMREV